MTKQLNGVTMEFNKITLFPDHAPRSHEWIAIARDLYEAKIMAKEIERKEKELEEKLKLLSDVVSSKGGDYVYSLSERLGSIQYKDIEILKSMDLEKYRSEPVSIWKLLKV